MAKKVLVKKDFSNIALITTTADTGSSVSLANPFGNLCNFGSANANTNINTTNLVAGAWARILINNGTSEPTVDSGAATKQQGSEWLASTDMYLDIWTDGTTVFYNFVAISGDAITITDKAAITIENPSGTEDISMFFTNKAITITEMRAVLKGSATPSVTWTIRHATDRSATGNEVVTSGTTTTSTTTGSDVTSFNDATIPADSFVWIETTAQSGTVDELNVTLHWTED